MRPHAFFLSIRRHCCSSVGLEGTQPAPPPARPEIGRAGAVIGLLTELIGEVEEGAEQGGTVVLDEFDQPGFLDQAAEFDEVAGAGAAVLNPLRVSARARSRSSRLRSTLRRRSRTVVA